MPPKVQAAPRSSGPQEPQGNQPRTPSTSKPITMEEPVWKKNNPFTYNKDLPVYRQKQEILDAVRDHKVTIISGTTGCGKSTHIPLFIMDEMEETGQANNCNIIVAMPHRIIASSVADYLKKLRRYKEDSPEKLKIGYQVGQNRKVYDKTTKILFCTTEVLLQKLCAKQKFSHIIIDEVHDRSEDVDFALLLIKFALNGQLDPLTAKVIIMSATMDVDRIQKYLAEATPKIVEIRQERYHIDVKYLDDFGFSSKYDMERTFKADQPRFDQRIMRFVVEQIVEICSLNPGSSRLGTIVIFVPGLEQIEMMLDALRDLSKKYVNWQLLALHSLAPFHEQQEIFQRCELYVRRIVVATSIAESSVTLPDVEIVFDFCLTKRMNTDDSTGLSFLQMEWISKSDCEQRKGRTGRVMNGKVVRLVPKWFYEELRNHPYPEMKRTPITGSLLRLKGRLQYDKVGLRLTPAEVLVNAMEPQDANKVRKAVLLLKERGALSLYCRGKLDKTDGDLTKLGNMCIGLPIDSQLTRLIHFGFCLGLIDDAICLAALISVRGIFCVPFRGDHRVWMAKRIGDGGLRSDCLDSFVCFREWKLMRNERLFSDHYDGQKREKQWCQERGIHLTRLQEASTLIGDLRHRLEQNGLYVRDEGYFFEPFSPTPTWELLIKVAIAGAFYPSYVFASNSAKGVSNGQCVQEWDQMASIYLQEELAGKDPLRTVVMELDPPEGQYLTALYQEQIKRAVCNMLKIDVAVEVISRGSGFLVTFPYSEVDSGQGMSMYAEMLLRLDQITAMSRIQRLFMLKPVAADQEAQIKNSIELVEHLQKDKAGIHAKTLEQPKSNVVEVEISTQNLAAKNEHGVELKKADSPYKITGAGGWKWAHNIGSNRDIEVHYDSINSISIRHRKPDPVKYMMVCSGEVLVSRRLPASSSASSTFGQLVKSKMGTRKVILTETTLMPHRPGFAALIAAIFAPVTDVRYDREDPEKPIGFLCGLGASGPNEPLNAAHDFLALTDGALTATDLEKIEKIRRCFNKLPTFRREIFDAHADNPNMTEKLWDEKFQPLYDIQKDLQTTLLELLLAPREVEIHEPPNPKFGLQWKTFLPASNPATGESYAKDRFLWNIRSLQSEWIDEYELYSRGTELVPGPGTSGIQSGSYGCPASYCSAGRKMLRGRSDPPNWTEMSQDDELLSAWLSDVSGTNVEL